MIYGTDHYVGVELLCLAAFFGLVITPACKLGYIADDLDMIAIVKPVGTDGLLASEVDKSPLTSISSTTTQLCFYSRKTSHHHGMYQIGIDLSIHAFHNYRF